MSAYTDALIAQRAVLQARLDAYLANEARINLSQEYGIGQGGGRRQNRRADLAEVRAGIAELRAEIAAIDAQLTPAAAPRRVLYLR